MSEPFQKWQCFFCGYIYDELAGSPDEGIAPGTRWADIPDDWMVSCCEPSVVQLASDGSTGTCWQWCDLPPQYTNWTSDSSQRMNQFLDCITFTARATNSSFPPSAVLVSAAARDGVLGDGVFGIIAVFVLAVSLLSR